MNSHHTPEQADLFIRTVPLTQDEIEHAVRMAHHIQSVTLARYIVAAASFVGALVVKGFVALRVRREQARVIEQLRAMSDFQLKDIGMTRSDIVAVAQGADPAVARRQETSNNKATASVVVMERAENVGLEDTAAPRLAA